MDLSTLISLNFCHMELNYYDYCKLLEVSRDIHKVLKTYYEVMKKSSIRQIKYIEYDNRSINCVYHRYPNGVKHGLSIYYKYSVKYEVNYVNDKREGIMVSIDKDGYITFSSMVDNLEHGYEYIYNSQKILISVTQMHKGLHHGVRTVYNHDKSIMYLEYVEYGMNNGLKAYYYLDANPHISAGDKSTCILLGGNTYVNMEGIYRTISYVNNRLDGPFIEYYRSGSIHATCDIYRDKVSNLKFYHEDGKIIPDDDDGDNETDITFFIHGDLLGELI